MRRTWSVRLVGFLVGWFVGVSAAFGLWVLAQAGSDHFGFIYRPWWGGAFLALTAVLAFLGGRAGSRLARRLGRKGRLPAPPVDIEPEIGQKRRRVGCRWAVVGGGAVAALLSFQFAWPFLADEWDCGLLYCGKTDTRMAAIARLRTRGSVRAVRDLARTAGFSVHLRPKGLLGPGRGVFLEFNPVCVRLAAIEALASLGPAAKEALPALEKATRDFNPDEVREAAAAAILKIRPAGAALGPK